MLGRAGVALIAVAAVAVNLWLQVDWRLALGAGAVVVLAGEIAGRVVSSRRAPGREAVATPPDTPVPAATRSQPLTRREVEIATLVAQGLTNKEIAGRLFISERTVDNHVQHVYNKLDIGSRPQLALWIRDQGLL